MKKVSDSDYKAQDEGSAPEALPRKKIYKKNTKTKKQTIQQMKLNFIPQGIKLENTQSITQEQYSELLATEDAPQFTLNFKTFIAKIIKVVDGDTVKAVVFLNNKKVKFTFRLDGIDTPQCRKGDVKQFGKLVKDITTSMMENKIVKIQAGAFDKYGRALGRIYSISEGKQFCLNEFLIQYDMAKSYSGKTKNQFTIDDYNDFKQKYQEQKWPITTNYPLQNIAKENLKEQNSHNSQNCIIF